MARNVQPTNKMDAEAVEVRLIAAMVSHDIKSNLVVIGGNGGEILRGGEYTDGDSIIYATPDIYDRIKSKVKAIECEKTIRLGFYVVLACVDFLPTSTLVGNYRVEKK